MTSTTITTRLLNFISQLDVAPPHCLLDFRTEKLSERWIGRAGPDDNLLLSSPSRFPDIRPYDLFLGDASNVECNLPHYM